MKLDFEFIDSIIEIITEKNKQIFEDYNNEKFTLNSIEMLSFLYSSNLQRDLEVMKALFEAEYETRYLIMLLRNMCEHVIEYLYLSNDVQRINHYMNPMKLDDDAYMERLQERIEESSNFIETQKTILSLRYEGEKKPSVHFMAKDIGEAEDTEDKLSLYSIFGLLSNYTHNSYYEDFMECVGLVDDEEENLCSENYIIDISLDIITTRFIEKYNEI